MEQSLLPDSLDKIGDNHEEYDEAVVVCHLHMVCQNLKTGEYRRDYEAPKVLAPVCQSHASYHRRQVGQGHDFPYMAGSNDDEEIA